MLQPTTANLWPVTADSCNLRPGAATGVQFCYNLHFAVLPLASSFATTGINSWKKSFNRRCLLLPLLMNFATTFNQGVRRGCWTASGGARDCKLPELQPATGVAGAATITSEGSCNPRAKFLLHVDPGEKHERRRRRPAVSAVTGGEGGIQ